MAVGSPARSLQEPVRIGVVGTGFLAATRARCWALVKDAKLAGVAGSAEEKAQEYAERFPGVQAFASFDALLDSSDIDVVDLCVPNRLHRSFGVQAAEAGKHVVCTKPLTAYVGQDLGEDASDEHISSRRRANMLDVAADDARAMIDAASRHGVRLFYGENWIYAPAYRKALELLDRGAATVLEMRGGECHKGSHSEYAKVWRHTGGGALLRLGAHPIGAMLHLKRIEGMRRAGRAILPAAVVADVADLTRIEHLDHDRTHVATGWQDVENWGSVTIRFDDGSRGVAFGSDNVLGGMESRLELMANNCRLRINLSPNNLAEAYAPDPGVFGDAYLIEKIDSGAGWTTPMPDEDWTSGQLDMCRFFARDLLEGREPEADGALGLDVVRVIYAAYQSAEEGRVIEVASP